MEMFTSQDPEMMEIETEMQESPEEEESQDIQIPILSDQVNSYQQEEMEEVLFTDQAQDQTLVEIRDLLRDYLVEETTEETTDYVKLLYEESKSQGEDIKELKKELRVSVQDQQTIGILSVGSTVLLIGALTVFFFLGRIR